MQTFLWLVKSKIYGIFEYINEHAKIVFKIRDSPNLYKQRKSDIESLFSILDQKLQSSNNPIQIEYAYLGLTDDFVYDLRKDAYYSSKVQSTWSQPR